MSDTPLFISYSRKDLYFAEGVVLALQRAGVRLWFDLQQLEPGADWAQEIKRGLSESSAVVVIVSRGARTSPWVTGEWEHAIETGKPIHVLIFEAVPIDVLTLTLEDQTTRTVDLPRLIASASSIIDARADFSGVLDKLRRALDGAPIREPIPTPNTWNLPTRLPWAVTAVAAALALFTLLLGAATVLASTIDLLMTVGWAALTFAAAGRTLAFVRREDYRSARIMLLCGVVFAAIFALWALPFIAIGCGLALFSPDVHRHSPLSQGLRRGMFHVERVERRKRAQGFRDRLAVFYGRLPGVIKALMVVGGGMAAVLLPLTALSLSSQRRPPPPSDLLTLWLFAIAGAGLVIAHFVLNRRHRFLIRQGLGKADSSGLTYAVIGDTQDEAIGLLVHTAMQNAGHATERPPQPGQSFSQRVNADTADVVIVLLTDNLPARALDGLLERQGRIIFVLASSLSNPDQYQPFARYQWVDFRRQTPGVLDAMAEDILIFGADVIAHSFGTRQTPQSFDAPILPTRVNSYLMLQYFGLSLTSFFLARAVFLRGGDAFNISMLITAIPSLIIGVWVVNRIIRREITVESLVIVNLVTSVALTIVNYLVVLSNVPRGMQINSGMLMTNIIANIIGLVIGYFVARALLRRWIGGWLPTFVPFSPPFPGFIRDWKLWRRNALVMAVIIIFTLVSLGVTPQSERREPPTAVLLRQGASPISIAAADFVRGIASS